MSTLAPYGSWKSPLSAASIARGAVGYAEIQAHGEDVYWLESRPEEAGRVSLVRNGERVTSSEFSVRTRVHEYGGGSYLACGAGVYFVNFSDQELYRIENSPQPVTHTGKAERYADFCHPARSNLLIAVCESHSGSASGDEAEVFNRLVCIDLATGKVTTLHQGHDFYAAPRICGSRIAFIAWDHPNMPWDATLLYLADFDAAEQRLTNAGIIAGGSGESIMEPNWGDERLFFLSDATGWWNIWCFDDAGISCLHEAQAEFGSPAWVFALHSYAVVSDDLIIARRSRSGDEDLVIVEADGTLTKWHSQAGTYDSLHWRDSPAGLLCVTGSPGRAARIEYLSPTGDERSLLAGDGGHALADAYVSVPESIEFETQGGSSHAYFYPPTNPEFIGPMAERPPLLVTTHGGPTAAARRMQNLRIQYYTSRGWAVADLNYTGSTGYGREYRQRLKGQWGVADVRDCEALVAHLADLGRIDPLRSAIRGGSAGGYTTLAVLTFSKSFQAGASSYGISDLEALARDTHKFESRYLDSLVGPWPEERETYQARSPIHHTDKLSCPIIFFQGGKDPIVPPNQAQMMVRALDEKAIPHAYVFYPDEAHGFRDAKNIINYLESEYAFFCRVFGITGTGMPSLVVKHL